MLTLNSQNLYPHSVWMEINTTSAEYSETGLSPLDLYLTINFNEHWESLLGGKVKIGLQSGQLKINLNQAKYISNSSTLVGQLQLADAGDEDLSINQFSSEELGDHHPKSSPTTCQILPKITSDQVGWSFIVKPGETSLRGCLKKVKLATLQPLETLQNLTVTFEINSSDLYIVDAEGLWRHDIHPNQHAILERLFALYFLTSQPYPCLSYSYLSTPPFPLISERELTQKNQQNLAQLQTIFEQILHAKNHHFQDLITLANLNPSTDLAGGVFRGTELRGIDLTGADLHHINLRGSELCDADLSDTNLSYAKLGGADLSGAFLGSSDLNHADLHRASLALANLSGANLAGANLHEVNLVNTNLSGVNVTGAKFGKNLGITPDLQQHLIAHGAIFEE